MNTKIRGRGFTLIELLVVVAIIALLISILLPGLNAAREAARVVIDMSNQKQITLGAITYLTDGNSDLVFAFPFNHTLNGQTPITPSINLISEFIWGGNVPDKDLSTNTWRETGLPDADNPYTANADFLMISAKDRPLNRYIYPGVSFHQPDRTGRTTTKRWTTKMDLPGVFKCPSDKTVAVPQANATNRDQTLKEAGKQSWDYYGTSFAINWYWPYYYAGTNDHAGGAKPGNMPPYTGGDRFSNVLCGTVSLPGQPGFPGLGKYLLKDKGGRWASEFILFQENRLNFALEGARPRGLSNNSNAKNLVGWHGKMNMHVASYLDGSSRYERYDTRYVDGRGWTTWPNKPWTDSWAAYNNE